MPKKNIRTKRVTSETAENPLEKNDLKTSVTSHDPEDISSISSSIYSAGTTILNPEQFRQKVMLAVNILAGCKKQKKKNAMEKYLDLKEEPILNKLEYFTNLPTDELKELKNTIKTRDRTFNKAFKDIKTIPHPTVGFLGDDIRRIFFKCIVEEKCFPSKMHLLKELKTVSSKYINEAMTIAKLVSNNLLQYRYFSEFNRYILTEHPERVYERTLYLKKMSELRTQGRNFVYVEVKRIIPRSTSSCFIAGLAAFPESGKVEKFFTKDLAELIAKKWLQQRIIPLIPEDCIVVFCQPEKRKKLSPQSKKANMIAWLEEHGIPYEESSHTAELYGLYNSLKNKVRCEGIYDHIFLNAGIKIIHCPVEWRNLSFFKVVWAEIQILDGYHCGRPETLKQNILNAMECLHMDKSEEALIAEEAKMLVEDEAMEEIIENLLEILKEKQVEESDFPKDCVADKADFFEAHVGNFVYDMANH